MKRFISLSLLAFMVLGVAGCTLFGAKGRVYITVETIGATLITVKFLEPLDNAGSYPNVIGDRVGNTSAAGYDWYIYEVSSGSYDVYIEWTGGIGFNGRARVLIDPDSAANEWAAVYADTGGNVWAEEGGGAFSPGLYNYP